MRIERTIDFKTGNDREIDWHPEVSGKMEIVSTKKQYDLIEEAFQKFLDEAEAILREGCRCTGGKDSIKSSTTLA